MSADLRTDASRALQYFTGGWWTPPYTATVDDRSYRVFPVHSKTGFAAARQIMLAHAVRDAAGVMVGDRITFAARWICALRGYARDAVFLESAESSGSFCHLCTAKSAPDGPGVYRLTGHDGELLYIGSSGRVRTRILQHQRSTHWRDLLAAATFTSYPTLAHARAAEIVAIKAERPQHNRLHVVRKGEAA